VPIGIPELIIVLVILLVIFGPKRLPGLGRSLGSGMREFKDSIAGQQPRRRRRAPRADRRHARGLGPDDDGPGDPAAPQAAPATPEPAESTVPTERSV
jgi:sec-independent protein translocase protein TatA